MRYKINLRNPLHYFVITVVAAIVAGIVIAHYNLLGGLGNDVNSSDNTVVQTNQGENGINIFHFDGELSLRQGTHPLRITKFGLENLAAAVIRQQTDIPLKLKFDLEGSPVPVQDLNIKYGWSEKGLAYSPYSPDNPLVVTPDFPIGPATAYLYVETPDGSVTTKSCTFFVLEQQ